MLLVALSNSTSESLAASGMVARLQEKYDLPLAIIASPRVAAWFGTWPGHFWNLVLPNDNPRALHVQWSLHQRLAHTHPAVVVDLGCYPLLRALPSRLSGGYTFAFYRRRNEPLVSALHRLRARIGEDALPAPCHRALLPDSRLGRHASSLLPGGDTRPWIALAPGSLTQDEDYHDFWAQLSDVLFLPGGVLPGGRIVLLGAPGESESLAQVGQVYLESLDDKSRVRNLVAQTSLALAASCISRARLVITTNNVAAQLAAVSAVPCLRLLRSEEPHLPHLPLWQPNQAEQVYPCSDEKLGEVLRQLLNQS
ncbi:MAG: hypothetical protein OD811_02555 [Alphaproteobacteria bacterium]